ncbi:MAG: DMT family transporter [Rhodobacterales bacterium]|nr:DMT family transporter [Rhodobacterales bacterium]
MTRADWIRLTILSILWGGSFPFVEVALEGLPVLTIVWARVALAATILALVLAVSGAGFPPRAVWPALGVMGFFNNMVPFTLFVAAQGQITGALASVLNATTPLFTVLVAHLATTDERITGTKAVGLGLGFAGVVVMLSGEGLGGEGIAMLACLMAALSYGVAGVWGRRFRVRGVAPPATAFGQVTASTVLILPVWLWVDAPWGMGWPGLRPVAAVVALAGLSTALAYLLFFRLLAEVGATRLSMVTFLIPVSASFLGWLILGEALRPGHLAGFALIVAGLLAIDGRMGQWPGAR